jgi:hypothetical protein
MDGTACGDYNASLGVLAAPPPNGYGLYLTSIVNGCVNTKSSSVYADTAWKLTDRFNLDAGLRWNQDKKTATVYQAQYASIAPNQLLPQVLGQGSEALLDLLGRKKRVDRQDVGTRLLGQGQGSQQQPDESQHQCSASSSQFVLPIQGRLPCGRHRRQVGRSQAPRRLPVKPCPAHHCACVFKSLAIRRAARATGHRQGLCRWYWVPGPGN